jgi:hypothetical protein
MSLRFATTAFLLSLACCSKDESPVSVQGGDPSAGTGAGAGAGADPDAGAGAGAIDPGEHPLKAWMKTNAAARVNHRDFEGLNVAFEKLATFAPPDYPFWASIARDGADAARVQDIDAVRGACRGCHSQYRDRYKRELRARPIGT